jgi:hypothetical protein
MNSAIKKILLGTMLLATSAGTLLQAAPFIQPKLMVQTLCTKPQFARNASQDLLLHADDNGSTYLYVEQGDGAILTVFDVTDPKHMSLTASVVTEGHGAYDFVAPIGNSKELVAFRDGSGTAVVDFDKPTNPRLSVTKAASHGAVALLNRRGYASVSIPEASTETAELQKVVLMENGHNPRLLSTMKDVNRQVTRPETGTTFLLAKGKITVFRERDAERRYIMDQNLKYQMNQVN